jgi:hypothetical protein
VWFAVIDPRHVLGTKGENLGGCISDAEARWSTVSNFHILSAKKSRIHSSELLSA